MTILTHLLAAWTGACIGVALMAIVRSGRDPVRTEDQYDPMG